VLRERSWREGDWEAFAGPGAPAHMDLGGRGDQLAADRLPLIRPAVCR
jgi:hypothetical protein